MGQHRADLKLELDPNKFMRTLLWLGVAAVIELGGIFVLLWEKLK